MNYKYDILGTELEMIDSITDLGVIFDANLNFSKHIQNLCQKARCSSLTILRCFYSRKPELLFRAFATYTRPIVEYCSPVWNPYRLSDIRKIEKIQRKFTKRLCGMKNISYMERLKILKADTLEMRRLKADLILYYKIIHGLVSISASSFFKFREGNSTRGHSLTIYKDSCKNNIEKYTFKNRSVNLWNKLPSNIVNAPNLKSFKCLLEKLPVKLIAPFLMIK